MMLGVFSFSFFLSFFFLKKKQKDYLRLCLTPIILIVEATTYL